MIVHTLLLSSRFVFDRMKNPYHAMTFMQGESTAPNKIPGPDDDPAPMAMNYAEPPRHDALLVNAFFACLLASVLPAASPRPPQHRLCYSKQCNRCSATSKNQ